MSYLVLDVMAEYTDRTTGNRQIRAQLIADTAADLPANTTALTWLLGSYAKAVDTGKEYYIDSGGTWIEQPSNNAFDNVYTKAETDALFAAQDAKIYGHDSVQVDLNVINWTLSGSGLYFSNLITTMTALSKIYALSLSGFSNLRPTDIITPACNRTGGWRGFRLYSNTNSFNADAWVTVSGIGEKA